jgi:hypothetical protein
MLLPHVPLHIIIEEKKEEGYMSWEINVVDR